MLPGHNISLYIPCFISIKLVCRFCEQLLEKKKVYVWLLVDCITMFLVLKLQRIYCIKVKRNRSLSKQWNKSIKLKYTLLLPMEIHMIFPFNYIYYHFQYGTTIPLPTIPLINNKIKKKQKHSHKNFIKRYSLLHFTLGTDLFHCFKYLCRYCSKYLAEFQRREECFFVA